MSHGLFVQGNRIEDPNAYTEAEQVEEKGLY